MPRSSLSHRAYVAVIAIKGFDGAVETIAGLVVAVIGTQGLYSFLVWIAAPEISHNPDGRAAHFVQHGVAGLAHASAGFLVIYLLAHGLIKLGIAINLLREKRWIFPIATVMLLGFIVYMSHRLTIHWSDWLLAFVLFDVVTLVLVLNEWRNLRTKASNGSLKAFQ